MKLILAILMILSLNTVNAEQSQYIKYDLDNPVVDRRFNERSMNVLVGDSTRAEFCPKITIAAWGDECRFSLDFRTDTMLTGIMPSLVNNRLDVSLRSGERTRIYRRDDGNLEWEIELDNVPDTNIYEFHFESKGLRFVYQDTSKFDSVLRANSIYPDSAVYSWIAYHQTRRDNWRIISVDNDTTYHAYYGGIAFTIYRPKVVDSRGRTEWCLLEIDTLKNILSIEIPWKFLMEADYPITVDPTIGNSTQEGFFGNVANWVHTVLYKFSSTAEDDGILTNAYIYSYNNDYNYVCTVQVGVYTYDSDVANCDSVAVSTKIPIENYGSGSIQWNLAEFPGCESIGSGEDYIVTFIPYSSGGACLRIAYGFSAWGDIKYATGSDWTFPSNLTGYQSTNSKWAVYAEYTINGNGNNLLRRRHMIRGGN
ncbi:MAG: hypothetical protein ABIJ45_10405 [Candidatus Zixiibacteriota bacterium]